MECASANVGDAATERDTSEVGAAIECHLLNTNNAGRNRDAT